MSSLLPWVTPRFWDQLDPYQTSHTGKGVFLSKWYS